MGRRLVELIFDYQSSEWIPDSFKKAVIFTPESVGDAMATYPILRALQQRGVEWIGIVTSNRSASVFQNINSVSLYSVQHNRNYSQVRSIAKKIRKDHGHIDLCVDASIATSASAYFIGTLRASSNLQKNKPRMRAISPVIPNDLLERYPETPSVIWWAQAMAKTRIAAVSGQYEYIINTDTEKLVHQWAQSIGPYILFNLDGGAPERCVSRDKATILIRAITKQTKLPIVIPYDRPNFDKAKSLSDAYSQVALFPGEPSLDTSAALVKYAHAVISPDTAIIHIASAFNKPTLGIYLSKGANLKWRPLAMRYKMLVVDDSVNSAALTADMLAQGLREILDIT